MPSDDPKHIPPSPGQWEPQVPAQGINPHPSRLKIAVSCATATPRPGAPAELAPISPAQQPPELPAVGRGLLGRGHLLRDASSARPRCWPAKGCRGPSPGGIWEESGPGDAAGGGEDGFVGTALAPGALTEAVAGEKAELIAQCRKKDICVTRGSQPGRAVKDVQEQLDDGERDVQTHPPSMSRASRGLCQHRGSTTKSAQGG